MTIQALLFDKDGTLFDFSKTWNNYTLGVIEHFAAGSAERMQWIAETIEFDLVGCAFLPTSPIIAGTNREAAELLASAIEGKDADEVEVYLSESAKHVPLAPVLPLKPYLSDLKENGFALGVVTNDSEQAARDHLRSAEALDVFDFVAGYDSGFGEKPDPDPLLAFAQQIKSTPDKVAMIGDSTHDLIAGRRAGMVTIGVLTGLATETVLAEFADVILPDISHIPDWLTSA